MIHRFSHKDLNFVLDVNSGSVHLMDKLAYDMVGKLPSVMNEHLTEDILKAFSDDYTENEIKETYSELYSLYKDGALFSVDDYDKFDNLMSLSPIKALCLHIAHDCNMRCEYCFASTGDYNEGRTMMSLEIGKKAIDYLLHHSKGRRNLECDFFGGEPLMNFDVVKEIVKYARSKEAEFNKVFRFTITTNGLLLTDDKIEFINKEMHNVVLSIDGRPEVNDRVRKNLGGGGCYASVMPKFKKLVDGRGEGQYYVRGTFTKYNIDFANDVLHLNSLGFDQISVEPVVADEKMPYALTLADIPAISSEYDRLAEIMLEEDKKGNFFNFFHFMMDLEQGPCAIKRLRGCGCGNEYMAITPDGDVYPCHQFVGHEEWKMGNVLVSNDIDIDIKTEFSKATVYGKEECKECWAKFYCSGGCNANSHIYNGNILVPHKLSCELEKKRVEAALYLKAASMLAE